MAAGVFLAFLKVTNLASPGAKKSGVRPAFDTGNFLLMLAGRGEYRRGRLYFNVLESARSTGERVLALKVDWLTAGPSAGGLTALASGETEGEVGGAPAEGAIEGADVGFHEGVG